MIVAAEYGISENNMQCPCRSSSIIKGIRTYMYGQTVLILFRLLLYRSSVDQSLYCLPFHLHLLDAILNCEAKLSCFKDSCRNYLRCPNFYHVYGMFRYTFIFQLLTNYHGLKFSWSLFPGKCQAFDIPNYLRG